MASTRRLSLTLLLVTPIIAARRLGVEDLGLSGGAPGAWGDLPDQPTEPPGEWDATTEATENYEEVYDLGALSEFGPWLRRKRDLDSPGGDLETAEQVLFRPTFRYKHLVKEREQHHKLQELRRQFTQNSPVAASSSPAVASLPPSTPTVQRKYYNVYPQQGQGVPTAHRVYSQQSPSPQQVYSQVPPAQGVFSQQITPQRVYPSIPPRPVGLQNYQNIAQPSSQYPKYQLFTQNNQGYRPQRSPYSYYYSQRLN